MNVPKIRFKEFKENWDNPIIDSIFELRNGYTPSKSIKEYWENGTIPWYRMEDIRAKGNILSEAFQYITPLAIKGSGLFKPYSIILATTATIGVHAMVIADSLANQQFTNFSIRKSLLNKYMPEFVNYAFYKIDRWSEKNTNSGGLLSVDVKSLLKEPFYTPYYNEQQKIASYFQSLDSLIQSTSKKLASLKQIKAASLQSMFPQEGETVPKVRFKGFEREWEPVKLSKIGYMTAGGTPSTFVDKYWNGEINWLQSGIVQNRIIYTSSVERKITAEGLSNSAAHMIKKDSVLIAITGATCANIGYLTFESAANQSVVSIEPNNNFYSKFIYSSLISERSQILSFKGGSAQSGVTLANLKEILLKCPSFGEQVFIGDYFFSLEKNIELLTQRLEKLKQIKVACLDKMFV